MMLKADVGFVVGLTHSAGSYGGVIAMYVE
jgi:hypothetical protein